MHICSILTSLTSGGAEMLVANLSKEYVAAGHKSTIVTLADAESVGNSAEMEAALRQRVEDEGGQVISLNLGRSRNIFKGMVRARSLLGSLRPDIVHAHTARALPMLLLRPGAMPVVLTHHNSRLSFSTGMFALFDRIVDAYVAISKETEEIFSRHVRRPIVHIPNAASKSFAAKAPRTKAATPARILSVGAISAQKNYGLLIDVAAHLVANRAIEPVPHFSIAGGGVSLEQMQSLVAEKKLQDHVAFLGERSDIADLMAGSDLYFNSSLYEGMPVALLEALASALPIVATKVPGNTELVHQEGNGLLAPLDDAPALANSIARLLSDTALYAECSQNAVKMSGDYSIEKTTQRHLELFGTLVSPDSGA